MRSFTAAWQTDENRRRCVFQNTRQAERPERTFIMYPNNIYIKNYAEVNKYKGDIGV